MGLNKKHPTKHMSEQQTKRPAQRGPMARGMPNTYVLVGGFLLIIIGTTQYFTLRSENAHLTTTVQELQRQIKSSLGREKETEVQRDDVIQERDSCRKEKSNLQEEKIRLKKEISDG